MSQECPDKERLPPSYQLGEAPLGEDPAGAGQVHVSGDPAPHVEPLHRSLGWRSVLPVQQHQLLLGPGCSSLQHPLQLQEEQEEEEQE